MMRKNKLGYLKKTIRFLSLTKTTLLKTDRVNVLRNKAVKSYVFNGVEYFFKRNIVLSVFVVFLFLLDDILEFLWFRYTRIATYIQVHIGNIIPVQLFYRPWLMRLEFKSE